MEQWTLEHADMPITNPTPAVQPARRRPPRPAAARRAGRRRRCGTGWRSCSCSALAQMYYLAPAGRPIPYSEFKALREERRRSPKSSIGDQIDPRHAQGAAGDDAKQRSSSPTTRVEDPKLTEELEAQRREVHRRGRRTAGCPSCSAGSSRCSSSSASGASSSAA